VALLGCLLSAGDNRIIVDRIVDSGDVKVIRLEMWLHSRRAVLQDVNMEWKNELIFFHKLVNYGF